MSLNNCRCLTQQVSYKQYGVFELCSRGVNVTKKQKLNCFQMSNTRKMLTLAMVRKTNSLLLGLKKKGFGEGKWNGFGGKVEKGETVSEGAVR